MNQPAKATTDLWWVMPNVLAGTRGPSIDPRRLAAAGQAPLEAFPDELPALWQAGIRAVVSLLDLPGAAAVYGAAGFAFHQMPVEDGDAPTLEQFGKFVGFVTRQRAMKHPVAVHCLAGVGRTGTALAGYLIMMEGLNADEAVHRVRVVRDGAVETGRQMQFLRELYASQR